MNAALLLLSSVLLLFSSNAAAVHTGDPCAEVECAEPVVPACEPDAVLTRHPPPPGHCCEPEPTCECDEAHCSALAVQCAAGFERFRVRQGAGTAGACCDQFECQPLADRCRAEQCPDPSVAVDLHALANDSCPPDSFRPPSYTPDDSCCAIHPDCKCRASACAPVRCPRGHTAVVEFTGDGLPGRCCDRFRCEKSADGESGCVVGERVYAEGEHWSPDSCQSCWCNDGVRMCRRNECPPVPPDCSWVALLEGECCPSCLGCQDEEGQRRDEGESWVKDDCTNCTCESGFRTSCQRSFCRTDCEHPRKIAGHCCPVCDDGPTIVEPPAVCASVELCPLRCEFGLHLNAFGCFECRCAEPPSPTATSANCEELNDQNCDKRCAHGYLRDARGCLACKCAQCPTTDTCLKSCLYGFQTNSLGCPVCKCKSRADSSGHSPHETGATAADSEGCLTHAKGGLLVRNSGEWWTDQTRCRQCFCHGGVEFCSLITCPQRPADCAEQAWQLRDGDCCPSCALDAPHRRRPAYHALAVCHSAGSFFVDGETWTLADSCVQCTCRVGHVLCHSSACPPTPCLSPRTDPNNRCCKYCPDLNPPLLPSNSLQSTPNDVKCTDNTGEHPLHSTWRTNECRSCVCAANGVAHCFLESCPPLPSNCSGRELMVKNSCCPICSRLLGDHDASCSYKEAVYAVGEEFRDGPCRNCTCKSKGIIECIQRQCPRTCDEQKIADLNGCCAECEDTNAYLHEGRTVVVEQRAWFPAAPLVLLVALAVAAAFCLCLTAGIVVGRCFYRQNKPRSLPRCATPKSADLHGCAMANVTLLDGASDFLASSLDRSDTSTVSTRACSSVHSDFEPSPHHKHVPSEFV
ncbi:CBN-CRM-1 protein [Aphelenchoides fujianensis]|nr:CBN-CRM-1 protein [Aphelenchoides fujianensis]